MFQLILEDSEISIYRYMERKTNNLFGDSINNANEITGTNQLNTPIMFHLNQEEKNVADPVEIIFEPVNDRLL